jgi:hypothetical protein
MITPHPRLKVNVAEKLACSIVAAAHASSPNLVGANESGSSIDSQRLFQQPASLTESEKRRAVAIGKHLI